MEKEIFNIIYEKENTKDYKGNACMLCDILADSKECQIMPCSPNTFWKFKK